MNYQDKLIYANAYLEKKAGVTWEDLPDINSLHDSDTEEDVKAACDARLEEDGFPEDSLDDLIIDDEDDDDYI